MKFTIVSHACLSAEASGKRLVIDPWITGSVYWGSWWHYPEPVLDPSLFDADFIYLTHWHFDHFHPESLARFDKRATILVPRFPVSTLVDQAKAIGFERIVELEQGEVFTLARDFTLASYQVQYQDDSVAVIQADGVTLVDLNDAKPLPSTWRLLRARYPKIDFMLRSHSPAWSYPSRYTFEDPSDAIPVSKQSYKEAFYKAAEILRPRYAIPFASGVCHLHREALRENDSLVTAEELRGAGVPLVVMPPGSSWSSDDGFELTSPPPEIHAYASRLENDKRGELEAIYQTEDRATLSFEEFERFFGAFFRSTELLRPFLRVRWTFEQSGEFWTVDFRRATLERSERAPSDFTALIRVHPAILANAIEEKTFTNIDISKRWRVHIARGGLTPHLVTTVLVSLFEAGYFDWRNLATRRFFSESIRRLPEIGDYLVLALAMLRKRGHAVAEAVMDPM